MRRASDNCKDAADRLRSLQNRNADAGAFVSSLADEADALTVAASGHVLDALVAAGLLPPSASEGGAYTLAAGLLTTIDNNAADVLTDAGSLTTTIDVLEADVSAYFSNLVDAGERLTLSENGRQSDALIASGLLSASESGRSADALTAQGLLAASIVGRAADAATSAARHHT